MDMEISIKVKEISPYSHDATMEVRAIINGREYHSLQPLREDANPVYFEYVWEKIGEYIKEEYMKSLKDDKNV